jgi:hypothetical protein
MEVAAGVGGGASAGAAVLLAVLAILGVFGETNTRKKPRLDASVLAARGQTDWDRIDSRTVRLSASCSLTGRRLTSCTRLSPLITARWTSTVSLFRGTRGVSQT